MAGGRVGLFAAFALSLSILFKTPSSQTDPLALHVAVEGSQTVSSLE